VESVQTNAEIAIHQGSIHWLGQEGVVSGIEGTIRNRAFEMEVSLNHLPLVNLDLSTQLEIKGILLTDSVNREQMLKGQLKSRGSVVNWKPLDQESQMDFLIKKDQLVMKNVIFMGGLRLDGILIYGSPPEIDVKLDSNDYSLETLTHLFSLPSHKQLTGQLDSAVTLTGNLWQPMAKGQLIIKNFQTKTRRLRNIQLDIEGVLPEVMISQSRLVTEDGVVMDFEARQMNIRELLDFDTYEALIKAESQEEVSWGDWRLLRREKSDSMSVERDVGDEFKVKYERFEHDEESLQPDESKNEMDVEVLLSDQESFNIKLKDDEEFIGVQRKVAF
jgi:hypothetical protein